ncbi:ParB-like protein [Andreprevotia chitinilytica]|uniref:ParB-like protein n=1 Tax=Andreprevotia chitinilytica TaxID=396808 RepID=UPI000557A695|nr:ParB-like protein [Andreprevotia chitinilytica]
MNRLFALLLLLVATALQAAPCRKSTPVGDYCQLPFTKLHPTQPAIGLMQVEDEMQSYTGKTPQELDQLMRKKEIPVVIGPKGRFYLTDRHHLSSALWRLHVPTATVMVIGKINDPKQFWPQMQERHWAWLYDQHGAPLPPKQLPKSLADLKDDPYRSLAGYAASADYYGKAEHAYFVEFAWARYFGDKLDWQPINRDNLAATMETIKPLVCLPAASELPGYRTECPKP